MDIQKLRQDTRGVKNVMHFNNAGASLSPQPVFETVINYLKEEQDWGGYETAANYAEQHEKVYQSIAQLLDADKQEIALMESATVAWDRAFYALPFQEGDVLLVDMASYISSYIAYLQVAKKYKVKIHVVPNDSFGQLDVQALENMISDKVKLISITHIPTNGGLVNPAKEVGKIAKKHRILYFLDACQSAGQVPLNVKEIGCDILSVTGRKYLRAPRGTGFLYVNQEILPEINPVFLDSKSAEWIDEHTYKVREDARKFETWERNVANQLGLGAAVDYLLQTGMENIWQRIQFLGKTLREKLDKMDKVTVRDLGAVKGGIVTFDAEGIESAFLQTALQERKINTSVTPRSGALLDMNARNLVPMVRASVHYYNTEEEINKFCEVVKELIH